MVIPGPYYAPSPYYPAWTPPSNRGGFVAYSPAYPATRSQNNSGSNPATAELTAASPTAKPTWLASDQYWINPEVISPADEKPKPKEASPPVVIEMPKLVPKPTEKADKKKATTDPHHGADLGPKVMRLIKILFDGVIMGAGYAYLFGLPKIYIAGELLLGWLQGQFIKGAMDDKKPWTKKVRDFYCHFFGLEKDKPVSEMTEKERHNYLRFVSSVVTLVGTELNLGLSLLMKQKHAPVTMAKKLVPPGKGASLMARISYHVQKNVLGNPTIKRIAGFFQKNIGQHPFRKWLEKNPHWLMVTAGLTSIAGGFIEAYIAQMVSKVAQEVNKAKEMYQQQQGLKNLRFNQNSKI